MNAVPAARLEPAELQRKTATLLGVNRMSAPSKGIYDLAVAVADQLTFDELDAMRTRLDIGREPFVRLLDMSLRTWERRRNQAGQKTGRALAERALRIARIHALAAMVLGGTEAARGWMAAPQPGLAGRVPNDLLVSEFGAREIEDMLHRIDASVYV